MYPFVFRSTSNIQSRGIGLKSWDLKVQERQLVLLEKAKRRELLEEKQRKKDVLYYNMLLDWMHLLDTVKATGGG